MQVRLDKAAQLRLDKAAQVRLDKAAQVRLDKAAQVRIDKGRSWPESCGAAAEFGDIVTVPGTSTVVLR